MSSIDNAIARIQEIALALSTIPDGTGGTTSIKSAPEYPIEAPNAWPGAITYLAGGEFSLTNYTVHHNFPLVWCEFHFNRANLKQAYQQIHAVAIEFPQRLAGDPTLNGTVETVVGGADNRIVYSVRPFVWQEEGPNKPRIVSQMLRFDLPIKLLKAPKATA